MRSLCEVHRPPHIVQSICRWQNVILCGLDKISVLEETRAVACRHIVDHELGRAAQQLHINPIGPRLWNFERAAPGKTASGGERVSALDGEVHYRVDALGSSLGVFP